MTTALSLYTLLAQTAPTSAPVAGDETPWMVYAVIALGMALALVVLEAFVPSGGVLGILAGVAAIAGVVMFFMFDTTWGMVSMGVTLLSLPFIVAGMMWLWPNTPIGRALTLDDSQAALSEAGPPSPDDPQAIVVGLQGEALTGLRPVGTCRLAGKRIDCVAQSGVIEPGTAVRVVLVEGATIKVKAV